MTDLGTETPQDAWHAATKAQPSGLRDAFHRSERLCGYAPLSPTLLLMGIGILVPVLILLAISLRTRDGFGFGFDTSLILIGEEPIFAAFLLRSFWMPGAATVAFHVQRRKLPWIVLMTLPFGTSPCCGTSPGG